jgi:hypothetical protein
LGTHKKQILGYEAPTAYIRQGFVTPKNNNYMITETITSFKDNIKRRFTNPFLGTFTAVYLAKNWELFYGIFNFDSYATQKTKIDYIQQYFGKINGLLNLLECIGYTFIVLIITYLLIAIARYLANIYNDIVLPWITKITDKSKIVSKEYYVRLYNEKEEIEKKYEKERENRARIQGERDSLENDIIDLKASDKNITKINELRNQVETLQSNISELEIDKANLQKKIAVKDKEKNEDISDSSDYNNNLIKVLYEEIKRRKLIDKFDNICRTIRKSKNGLGSYINDYDFFVENNIFKFDVIPGNSFGSIEFTEIGEKIFNIRLADKFNLNIN